MIRNIGRALIVVAITSICTLGTLNAQTKKRGFFGGIETNMAQYVTDTLLKFEPEKKFAINSWINLGYYYKNFRVGIQYEVYEPTLLGFSQELDGNRPMTGFMEYQGNSFSVRVGNIYEQFGSGIMFRTYEERQLGLDNSIFGGKIQWNYNDMIVVKAIAGAPRHYMKYAPATVVGADAELLISQMLFPDSDLSLLLGGGWVYRRDNSARDDANLDISPSTSLVSGRVDAGYGPFSLGGEYVYKNNSYVFDMTNGLVPEKGSAVLVTGGFDMSGFGVNAEFRRIKNMLFTAENDPTGTTLGLNYLPSLTRQHKYTLQSLYIHKVDPNNGEIGGQIDLFGELGFGMFEEYPLSFALNGSYYNDLAKDKNSFYEANLDLERSWSKKFKTILSFSHQNVLEFSKLGNGDVYFKSQTVVADLLYKITDKFSLRTELQHQWSTSESDQRWAMALIEVGLSPNWLFSVSDFVNYKTIDKTIHYYSVSGSFSHGNFRTALSFGRNRAGYQCVGGVCRFVPSYTGFNLSLNWTF